MKQDEKVAEWLCGKKLKNLQKKELNQMAKSKQNQLSLDQAAKYFKAT